EDTNKVKLLTDLSGAYSHINPNDGLKFGQQGLDLATRLDWGKGIAMTFNVIGLNYDYKSDYSKALEYYSKALTLYEKTGNKKGMATVILNIGTVYDNQ